MQKLLFTSGLAGIAALSLVSCNEEKKTTPPNIVVFIADVLSWNDFGCYGNEEVQTPNIDRIAENGIRFTNTYLTASSCSPSRVSILTGRYPHNTGAAELHTQPSVDLPGFADVLRENAYYCGQAGKWHAGEYLKSGFDTLHSNIIMNGGEGKWLELVENRPKDKAFFLWLAAIDAHRDWGENEFSGTHDPGDITPPVFLAHGEATRKDMAMYYDEIKRFDDYIGRVEMLLKEQGVLENTVIIIMADNGRPFPGCKTRVYDRGMKTPFIIKWDKGIKNTGSICESLVSVIDIAPTLLDFAGIEEVPAEFQGKSFRKLLENPKEKFRNYIFAEHNWHDFEAHERMLRAGDYMYVLNSRPELPNQGPADVINSPSFAELLEKWRSDDLSPEQEEIFIYPRVEEELYDCVNDPLQFHNLAGDPVYAEKLAEMRAILETWMDQTGDTVPDTLTLDWYDRIRGNRLNELRHGIRGEMPGSSTDAVLINNSGPF